MKCLNFFTCGNEAKPGHTFCEECIGVIQSMIDDPDGEPIAPRVKPDSRDRHHNEYKKTLKEEK